ncbi:MAG TPA: hypothetical protein VND64_08360 [Pirellulales bacterium]|nr:hypothetical protein [Pirellulales bacterium]
MNDPPFAPGQRRVAIFDGRALPVRLVRPAPDNAPAWICAVQPDTSAVLPDGCEFDTNGDALILVASRDISGLLSDDTI